MRYWFIRASTHLGPFNFYLRCRSWAGLGEAVRQVVHGRGLLLWQSFEAEEVDRHTARRERTWFLPR
jgi:hypothetical protein